MSLKPDKLYGGKLNEGRIVYLDAIRVVACFMVVFFHFIVAIPRTQQYLTDWGRIGVGMFFMISGASLINGYYGKLDIKSFYKKRFFAIYIPFYVAYIGAFIFLLVRNNFHLPFAAPKWTFIFTVLGLDGYLPPLGKPSFYILGEWFLPVIIFIYLIFPLWRIVFIKVPTITLISVFLLRALLILGIIPSPVALCFNIIPAISYFTLGAYLMLLSNNLRKTKPIIIIAVLFGIFLMLCGAFVTYRINKPDTGEIFSTLGLYLIIYSVADFIKNRYILRFIGLISSLSYEIFLLHHIVIMVICSAITANFGKITFVLGGILCGITILLFALALSKIVKFLRKIKFKKE